jgi:hypothetical protein
MIPLGEFLHKQDDFVAFIGGGSSASNGVRWRPPVVKPRLVKDTDKFPEYP